ncbi:DNA processing protein DprA [Philodulcilactobacillus myokoensis]|uniref:DNA processing protein DprA n=1 Tax=Philodulcilactobacillus myokoensis TaxID=2929573 RepID=A0A9W6B2D9_9LACO|nr:DNA-processing protein DprA [Philodulcilactobacillus myokoensis]GLB46874.1 DNA processing protein DprA [Philodulcilactobacillus myokoensis]
MELEQLLLKLRLCKGIGIHGENRFYQWLTHSKSDFKRINPGLIIKIAQINHRFQIIFKNDFKSRRLLDEMNRNQSQTKWISILNPHYPERLKESYLPPNILFYSGNFELVHQRLLSVVGSRQNTSYSIDALRLILPSVIKKKICIVSGLARGVDCLSHQCAISYGGNTIAVIGTGLDQYYPIQNQNLQNYIGKHHLLISEYPLGTGVARYHFPERNRILAGLIDSILVVEAKHRSGSLITANLALQNNRNVMAIPGPITSLCSVGCNELIAAGAKPVSKPQDVLEDFNY